MFTSSHRLAAEDAPYSVTGKPFYFKSSQFVVDTLTHPAFGAYICAGNDCQPRAMHEFYWMMY